MDLKWYVLNYNSNAKKIEYYNIFNNGRFIQCIKDLLQDFTNMDNFLTQLDRELMYCFWSKREYEISVGDAFEEDLNKYEKIDVYTQVKPNIEILAKYIIDNYKVS